jgi:hypothetical protein
MWVLGFNRFKDEFILYKTQYVPVTKADWLMLFKETDSGHCETTQKLCGQIAEL